MFNFLKNGILKPPIQLFRNKIEALEMFSLLHIKILENPKNFHCTINLCSY